MPDVGENVFGLIPQDPSHPPPFDFTADGFAFFTEAAYVAGFADSLPTSDAEFMRDSQIPISLNDAGSALLTVAAWRDKPTWYQTADGDHVIPPELQEMMFTRAGSTVQEVTGGHLAFVAHADKTAELIIAAATAVSAQ